MYDQSSKYPRFAPTALDPETLVAVRKQYHFRRGPTGVDAWNVDRLIGMADQQPVEQIPLTEIAELDTEYWYDHGFTPTVRSVAEHARLVLAADLGYPIVLDPDGGVMDGMHRVARALLDGRPTVPAKRLATMPEPDVRNCHPSDNLLD